MHALLHILLFWGLGFVSLVVTLVVLGLFWSWVEQDLYLKSLKAELAIALAASLIEGLSLWLILKFTRSLPGNVVVGLLIVPGLIVSLIYKVSHLEDWSRYEIIALLFFQLVISLAGAALLTGHFLMAISVAIVFAVALAVVAAFVKGL